VNLASLGKKLRREATKNPKKAALLGLMAIVAVWFWIPLVGGWIGKGNKDMPTAAAKPDGTPMAAAAATPADPAAEAVAKKAVPDRPSWQQIIQWMHNDPRTMTAPSLTIQRDPFEVPKIETAKTKAEEKPKPPKITPTAAGLALTSTIIGPQRRVAQINGETYVVGQTIARVKEKQADGVIFKLVEVQPRRAVLEADGQRFELTIPEPGKSDKIQFLEAVHSPISNP
jgi:hypothetical protein